MNFTEAPKDTSNFPFIPPLDIERYPLMEHFYTLQGEGAHSGKAAYFIRLAGCAVGCVWCDVKESWDAAGFPSFSASEITDFAAAFSGRLAVITGGEPSMYNLELLTKSLQAAGFKTNIETSGAYILTGSWDWVCLSPKKFKPTHPEVFKMANELKVVIYHLSDLKWAEELASKVNTDCELFLQPEWSKADVMNNVLTEYIKNNPKWRLSLQTHKFLNIP